MPAVETIRWDERRGELVLLDQRFLPARVKFLRCGDVDEVAVAIKEMAVRGAPAIGVAAAYGMALAALRSRARTREQLLTKLRKAAKTLGSTRPTAVNLFWALDRMMKKAENIDGSPAEIAEELLNEAQKIHREDVEMNKTIGRLGAELIPDNSRILTHCNAGALATAGYGTALGVIRYAHESGKQILVYASETRPRLQGAKLTAFELKTLKIPFYVVPDTAVAFLMSRGMIDCVVVGADRILAKTGHVINKIGTLSAAVNAHHFNIPFYVAAPTSTIDLHKTVDEVVIEERSEDEVHYVGRERITPPGTRAINYAFDITPPQLVTAVITEKGVFKPDELYKFLTG
ncbi:methylthioribose-1-phosphate isomerase [Candidatus Caldarchaeum subterraneum]|uniref:Putative methylthioribose-1-phosphate isomerase n=2 Tax=Caldiarchaeum subterraneum TaxID=311458 RepID=E6N647_CALS0|nr:methylthioribose-1-phosphate isomerase [Candidatus Caldarchaeum subterraneum]BAJ50635.1 methylthioribose-1-phosphate isomerase [Candidatus Caldarchaeum subterraneum]